MYPTQCTNPNVQAPNSFIIERDLMNEIEYESINDITMKDDTIPKINRSTKLAALKTYSDNKSEINISNLLEEQEKLADKSLQIEKKRLETEKNWKTLQQDSQNVTDDDEKMEIEEKEQELEYAVLQLDNEQRDIVRINFICYMN